MLPDFTDKIYIPLGILEVLNSKLFASLDLLCLDMLYIYPLTGLMILISKVFNSADVFMYNISFTGFGYEVIDVFILFKYYIIFSK